MRHRAVIYTPASDGNRWLAVCLDYCAAACYDVIGVVQEHVGGWDAACDMVCRGFAQILVVARREHLPRGRLPRLEVVAEKGQDAAAMPAEHRRPRRVGDAG